MDIHCSRCELEPVECPFQEAGCTARVVHREFDVLVRKSTKPYLIVLLQAFQETKRELGECQISHREKQTELGKCQRELGEKLDNTAVKLLETRLELEEGKPAAKKI